MRRSVFYMGRSFTQRHLNAARSPLASGFVRPNVFSSTSQSLVASPLCGAACVGAGGVAGANGALVASPDAVLSQLLTTILAQGKSLSVLANLVCIQNISTCVFACERVLVGFMNCAQRISVWCCVNH
ncbi:hypothetical protein ABL78_5219 [Leptomonas seymouri]|uniref:Uncharacterized protein n=1 Tax=Leptomonas seymouri TaxID=5684 RepID=A0A0N1HX62_LEPSE|nr:hypothetical protein ABL78_5219 [Leptomonas seymouri]|eukprot:KPI85732.1 hypothetical protein ABL78_5219 [Leptomonas seymouri]